MRWKLRDLEINNRVKDQVIERLEKDREAFNEERQRYVAQLIGQSRKVGELESQLLQLGAPVLKKEFPRGSEEFGSPRENGSGLGSEHNNEPTNMRHSSQDS